MFSLVCFCVFRFLVSAIATLYPHLPMLERERERERKRERQGKDLEEKSQKVMSTTPAAAATAPTAAAAPAATSAPTATTARATAPQDAAIKVARALSVEVSNLHRLSDLLLADAAAQMRLSLAERAELEVFVHLSKSNLSCLSAEEGLSGRVASSWAATEAERRQPWRAVWRSIAEAATTMKGVEAGRIASLFADLAKQGQVTEMTAMLVQALLFFGPDEQRALAAAALHFNATQTLQIFNYIAASREPAGAAPKEAFLEERGAALVALATPLWPREHSFAVATLQQLRGTLTGGGTGDDGRRLFTPAALARGPAFGGAALRVLGGDTSDSTTIDTTHATTITTGGGRQRSTDSDPPRHRPADVASLERQVAALERKLALAAPDMLRRGRRGGGGGGSHGSQRGGQRGRGRGVWGGEGVEEEENE